MKVLAIETSCDETAIAIVEAEIEGASARFRVLGNALLSQIELHKEYGGVFPALAKREHAKNLVPILRATLEEAVGGRADLEDSDVRSDLVATGKTRTEIAKILEREPELCEPFLEFISESERPAIDAIAVTAGPGLEPALWVGINFARALALVWDKPLVAVNHMEGHVMAALASRHHVTPSSADSGDELEIQDVKLPVLALLVSGGHTELVLMREWLEYERIGETRDDAVGEAFDKVARMLGLPYPGGPEISKLAEQMRGAQGTATHDQTAVFGSGNASFDLRLPRPMISDDMCDFSFAGLKTAVLNLLKKQNILMDRRSAEDKDMMRALVAREFEDAVADVLWKKTARALQRTGAQTLIIGGGVSANVHLQRTFREGVAREFPAVNLRIPSADLTTDNAVMIALAGAYRALCGEYVDDIAANGNLSLCPTNS